MNKVIISLLTANIFIIGIFLFFLFSINRSLKASVNTLERDISEKLDKQELDLHTLYSDLKEQETGLKKYELSILETQRLIESKADQRLVDVVEDWRPYVAHVICTWEFEDENELIFSGSGFVTKTASGDTSILTNAHVLLSMGERPDKCLFTLPENTAIYKEDNPEIKLNESGRDLAYLLVKSSDAYLNTLIEDKNRLFCTERAYPGERVIALGYPSIGAFGDVTITEGIISGYENDYYISSVKIDEGNSGGVAVLVDKNCYLGTPTSAILGKTESLARILDYRVILNENP